MLFVFRNWCPEARASVHLLQNLVRALALRFNPAPSCSLIPATPTGSIKQIFIVTQDHVAVDRRRHQCDGRDRGQAGKVKCVSAGESVERSCLLYEFKLEIWVFAK